MPEPADGHAPTHADHDEGVAPEARSGEDRLRAVPRASLGRRAQVALWALRTFAILVTFMVIYAFVARLQP